MRQRNGARHERLVQFGNCNIRVCEPGKVTTKDADGICNEMIHQPETTCMIRQSVKCDLELHIARKTQWFREQLKAAIQKSIVTLLQINALR